MNKHRNSTFQYGRRRSRSLGALSNGEVCKTIKKSLPSSQKLQLLLQYAIEHSLSMAEKVICEDVDDAFTKHIGQCQVDIESEIEEKNYCSLATDDEESNNASVTEKCEEYYSAFAKLEEEIRQWDELLARYRSKLDKETEVNDIHFEGQFNFEKYQHLDYSAHLKDIESVNTKLNVQINKIKRTSKLITRSARITNKGFPCFSKTIGRAFLETRKDSPRTMIKKCFLKL